MAESPSVLEMALFMLGFLGLVLFALDRWWADIWFHEMQAEEVATKVIA